MNIPGQNVSTTLLWQWGFWLCLLFSWTTLRGKHCWHPIAIMGVVDKFEQMVPKHIYNSHYDIGCQQCLPLSVVQLKGKHCQKPHCGNGVVDTFGLSSFEMLKIQNYCQTFFLKLLVVCMGGT